MKKIPTHLTVVVSRASDRQEGLVVRRGTGIQPSGAQGNHNISPAPVGGHFGNMMKALGIILGAFAICSAVLAFVVIRSVNTATTANSIETRVAVAQVSAEIVDVKKQVGSLEERIKASEEATRVANYEAAYRLQLEAKQEADYAKKAEVKKMKTDLKLKTAENEALKVKNAKLASSLQALRAVSFSPNSDQPPSVISENAKLRKQNGVLAAQVSTEQQEKNRHARSARALSAELEQTKKHLRQVEEAVKLAKEKAFVALDKAGEIITIIFNAITGVETGGNYRLVSQRESPRTSPPRGALPAWLTCKATEYCDYAYGRYQVMGDNIPSWTLKYLGVAMTPEEYLNNPDAQDIVARMMIAEYWRESITPQMPDGDVRVVAARWHSGSDNYNSSAKDSLGTSTMGYVVQVVEKVRSIRPDLVRFPAPWPPRAAVAQKPAPKPYGGGIIKAALEALTPSKKK